MNGRRLFSYILAITLFAAPAFGQIIPRSGGGGGAGGGGDASAANQATQITALPLEDDPHTTGERGSFSLGVIHTGLGNVGAIGDYSQFSTDLAGRQFNIPMTTGNTGITDQLGKREDGATSNGDTGISAMRVRRDVLIGDADVSGDGDFLHSFSDNTGATWVRNATVTKELFAAASASGSSTVVDTAGYTMGMIHFTTSGTWDRQGTFLINQSIGSTSPFKPAVGALEVRQASGVPTQVWQHVDTQAVNIGAVVDRVRGYMINLMGFQALQLELDITSGTAGTIEFHVHLYSGGSGFNQELSLGTDSDMVPTIGGAPPLIQMIGGRGTSQTNVMRALLIPDRGDASAAGEAGITAMFINNEDTSVIEATDGDYMPGVTDDAGRQIMVLSHNANLATSARATQAHDSVHAFGAIGMLGLGIRNDNRATVLTTATGDYSGIALTDRGEVWLAHSGAAFFAITDTAIAQVSQNFAFGFTSKKVRILAPSTNIDVLCIDHIGGTAVCPSADTAGDDVLEPGDSVVLDEHAVTSISAISASGSQTVVVRAFN